MRKPIAALMSFVIGAALAGAGGAPALADAPQTVRVGLESKFMRKAAIAIGNKSVVVGYERNGRFTPAADAESRAGFEVKRLDGYYVTLEAMYHDYKTAKAWSDAMAFPSVPHIEPGGMYHICVGPFSAEALAKDYAIGAGGVIHPLVRPELLLTDGGAGVLMFESGGQLADAAGGILTIGASRYRGRAEFFPAADGVSAINVLPTEAYLYGVVPVEMPSSYHAEALKAQAVAARTYAAAAAKTHSGGNYDLCDTTHCQAYGGADKETGAAAAAVDATSGQLAYYDGKPIEAMYFASSGGHTESSRNVWAASLPYLVSVAEMNEPPSAWTRTLTFQELDTLTNGTGIGQVMSVSVVSDAVSGRAQELTLTGATGLKTLKKEEIRSFFAPTADGSLASRMFSLLNGTSLPSQNLSPYVITAGGGAAPISFDTSFATGGGALFPAAGATVIGADGATSGYAHPTAAVSTVPRSAGAITFSGAGHGHGVGMSQKGANGMAQLGYGYEQILKHYYTGVEVR